MTDNIVRDCEVGLGEALVYRCKPLKQMDINPEAGTREKN